MAVGGGGGQQGAEGDAAGSEERRDALEGAAEQLDERGVEEDLALEAEVALPGVRSPSASQDPRKPTAGSTPTTPAVGGTRIRWIRSGAGSGREPSRLTIPTWTPPVTRKLVSK